MSAGTQYPSRCSLDDMGSVDLAFREPSGRGGPLVAACTYALIAGALDVAGQALLVSGLYAVWRGARLVLRRKTAAAACGMANVTAGWTLGFMLRAIWLLPFVENAAAWAGLGNAIGQQGEATEAVEAYSRALAIDPADAATLVNRAWARLDAGDRAGAKRDAEKALSLGHPADAELVRVIQQAAAINNAMEAPPPGRLIKP